MRGKILVGVVAVTMLALGVTAGAVLASRGSAQRMQIGAATPPLLTRGGIPCAMAAMSTRQYVNLNGTTYVNAGAVSFTKRCAGPVTALLAAQSSANNGDNSLIVVGAKITCIGKGGLKGACKPHSFHWAMPAGDPNANNQECLNCYANNYQAMAINLSWPSLPPGVYKIQVIARGSVTTDQIGYRTLQAIGWSKA